MRAGESDVCLGKWHNMPYAGCREHTPAKIPIFRTAFPMSRLFGLSVAIFWSSKNAFLIRVVQEFLSKVFPCQLSLFLIFFQILQNLGKADRTTDEIFEEHLLNFTQQQTSATRLYKDISNYIRCIKGNAFQSFILIFYPLVFIV